MKPVRLVLLILALAATGAPARAAMLSKTVKLEGLTVPYRVWLPAGYSPDKAYPLVLLFSGGGQSIQGSERAIAEGWAEQADKRGYIVVSPAAADGQLYFQGGDRIFPAFIEIIRKDYKTSGKIHVAGMSNGGLSAFHIAALYPRYFSTVTGYPGMLLDIEHDKPGELGGLCLFMHVGDRDDEWREAMGAQYRVLRDAGHRIKFTVEKNQVHRLKPAELGLPVRLFDEIESCR